MAIAELTGIDRRRSEQSSKQKYKINVETTHEELEYGWDLMRTDPKFLSIHI